VEFNLIKAFKFPSISGECHWIDVLDSLVWGTISNNVSNDLLEHCMLNDGTTKDKIPKQQYVLNSWKLLQKFHQPLLRWKR